MTQRQDLITAYLSYIGRSEAPTTFHRWCIMSVIGAWLGRRYSFQHGHSNIASNMYCMLMGDAGSRKTTAIKIASQILKKAGYKNIAAERTTKEKFLLDLAGESGPELDSNLLSPDSLMEQNLFGAADSGDSAEIFVAADEFNTFVGNGNIEFLSLLGVLWDYAGEFEDRKKNSKSIIINDPTVSILAGNTATGFSLAFPAEAIGQGIFSRLILIHGERTDERIAFPNPPSTEIQDYLVDILHAVRQVASGKAVMTPAATSLLEAIYTTQKGLDDVRFESYSNRRFTHLIKLCLISSASALRNTIEETDVLYANTVLTHAEHSMSKALGEFGKAKHSAVAHKLIKMAENSSMPLSITTLWASVHNDMDTMDSLKDLINNLVYAGKLLSTKAGVRAKRKVMEETSSSYVDFSLLSEHERKYIL